MESDPGKPADENWLEDDFLPRRSRLVRKYKELLGEYALPNIEYHNDPAVKQEEESEETSSKES